MWYISFKILFLWFLCVNTAQLNRYGDLTPLFNIIIILIYLWSNFLSSYTRIFLI
jgi:hypothetical protein